jgi:hypothetical protein
MNVDDLKLDSIAILIDCWDMRGKVDGNYALAYEEVYTRIIEFIETTPEIKIVVLASYDVTDFTRITENIWYKNTEKIKTQITSQQILNYVSEGKLQIALTSFDDLMNLLNQFPDIKNMYFMGTSWDDCIHNRPISIGSCSNIGKNILVDTKCVFRGTDSWGLDLRYNINFKHIVGDIYKLTMPNNS